MLQKLVKAIVQGLVGLAMMFIMAGGSLAADPQKTLRIAITDNYPPFTVLSPYGEAFGLYVDIWKLWSETTGIPVEFEASGWAETIEAVRTGKADIHSGLYKNKQRSEFLDFTDPIHVARNALFFRNETLPRPLSELKGLTVGVVKGTYQEQYLADKYPDILVVAFADNDQMIEAGLRGQVTAILSETVAVQSGLARVGLAGGLRRGEETLFSNLVFGGIAKGNIELLSKINESFEKLPQEKLAAIEKRWLPDPLDHYYMQHEGVVRLSNKEKSWLKANPYIRLAVTTFIDPVDIVDDKGNYTGLNADILKLIEKRIDASLRPEFFGSWSELVKATLAGKVDGAMSFSITKERQEHMLYTDPYAYDPVVIIAKSDRSDIHGLESLRGKRVSAVKDLAWMKELEENIGDGEVIVFESDFEALDALDRGRVDAHMSALILYGNAQKKAFVPGLKIVGSHNTEGGALRIATHKSKPVLHRILKKAVASLTKEELADLHKKWMTPKREDEKGVKLTTAERAWLRKHPRVRVAALDDWPPFESRDSSGAYQGVTADFIRAAAKQVGLELEIVFGKWDDHLHNLRNKKIDVAPGIFDTADRRAYLLFSEPYVELSNSLYVAQGTTDIHSIDDLKSRRVAVERSYAMHEFLIKRLPDAELVLVDSSLDALKAVIVGAADAYVGNQPVTNYLIKTNLLEGLRQAAFFDEYQQSLGFAVRNDWPHLHNILQKALDHISQEERQEIFGRWIFVDSSSSAGKTGVNLTKEEKSWLKQHPILRVHNESSWAPFNFNEGGNPRGFSIDYMNLLAEKIGVGINYISGPSWGVFLDMMRNKALDVMLNIVKTPERDQFIHFTPSYMSNPPAVITRKDSKIATFEQLKGKSVCIPEGFFYQEVLTRKYPEIPLVLTTEQVDCLKKVSEGEVDATIGGIAIQAHLISKLFLNNLKVAAGIDDPDLSNNLRIGVRKDWEILRNILSKAIKSVTSEELRAIEARWINIDVNAANDQREEANPYTLVFTIGGVALGLLVLLGITLMIVRRLARKDASHLYQSRELKGIGLAIVGVFLGLVILVAWLTIRDAEKEVRADAGQNLLTVLNTTHEALKAWAGSQAQSLLSASKNPGLVSLVEELVEVQRDKVVLENSIELEAARNWIRVHLGNLGRGGFSIITPDNVQIASQDNDGLGRESIIAKLRGDLLKKVFAGEAQFVPPHLVQDGDKTIPALFFMAPLKTIEGKVIAALALQDDPTKDFSRVTQLGRIGATGETYGLDQDGLLVSASRFDKTLRSLGLIKKEEAGLLNLKIRDPGKDLQAEGKFEGDLSKAPFTLMAKEATQKNRGINVEGYRDYRGIKVMGVWLWDEALQIGLATEIDEAEAMKAFWTLRRTTAVVLALTVLISLGLMGLSVWIGQSATRSLTKSRDVAEQARLNAEEARSEAEQAEEQIRQKVAEIERFNRLAMGREERIIELKENIDQLRKEFGLEPLFGSGVVAEEILDDASTSKVVESEKLDLSTMIDLEELQVLLENFCNSVGIASAIIDLKGEVLAAARWQRACTDFHRANEQSCARCIESDTELSTMLEEGKNFSVYKCKNGLTDAASPIVIDGQHLANVFVGQFLLGAPDTAFFKEQAKTFGYEESDYISAIGDVPVIPEELLPDILGFLSGFAKLVASLSVERLRAEKAGANQDRERAAALNLAEDAEIARAELSDYKDQLEELVEERTAELQQSEERTRLLLNSVGEGIFGVDLEGKITFVNPAVTEMLGYDAGELIGERAHPLFHHTRADGSQYPVEECWMYKSFTEGDSYRIDNEVLWRKDGTPLDIEYLSTPIRMHDKLVGAVITFMDISERKEAEVRLKKSEAQMRDILASSPIGAGITEADTGQVVFSNARQGEMFGWGETGFEGVKAIDVYANPDDRQKIMGSLDDEGRATDVEVEMKRKDGSNFWALMSTSPMTYEDQPARLAWFYDITERKQSEEKLKGAYDIISDSIQYASHIQRAVLTGEDMLMATMSEHMVLWEPRDVVGGDIYWCHIWGDGVLVVLGDCTGHGVPGAFMTLISTGALDRAMADVPPGHVSELIQRMHQVIQISLKQHGDRSDSDDGLELGACFLNSEMTKMTFAGARFPLFQVKDGEVVEHKSTKAGIGYRGIPQTQTYEEKTIDLVSGTTFYMTSDGYLDQVGGEKRRMFGKKRFKELLLNMQGSPLRDQKRTLYQALLEYQDDEVRRDDVAVVAFKV